MGITSTYEGMIKYTTDEWNNIPYYINVVESLRMTKIKSYIEVGACLGVVANLLNSKIPTIETSILIEALPSNFIELNKNLQSDKIKIYKFHCAVYYGQDFVTMGNDGSHESGLYNVGGFGIQNILANHHQHNTTVEIPTITLEEIIKGDTIDFIKIDVEGAEKNIIENSTALPLIKYMEIELHDELSNDSIYPAFLKQYFPDHIIMLTHRQSYATLNLFLGKI